MPWHKPRIRRAEGNSNGETVILLHGLWRSIHAMEPMAQYLQREGYHTVNVPYPSFTRSLYDITCIVEDAIEKHSDNNLGSGKINLVTHSMGGIVARELLAKLSHDRFNRLVMLAPPNQGSEIIDWLARSPPMRSLFGPAGMGLGASKISSPTLPDAIDSAVLMGNKSSIPFFRKLLSSDNDGIVSVESGKLDGVNQFQVIEADHTFISSEPRVMELTKHFLENGSD